jgi:oligopeptide/dipeptide ABC transporter ATP-binding protein
VTSTAPLLEARGLTRTFDVGTGGLGLRRRTLRAVEDVSFALAPGKVTALVGQSGSGKSTIARLLLRLYAPTSGSILLGDEDVSRIRGRRNLRRYRSQVQMIFQDPFGSLNPVKRVGHHVARPLRVHKVVPSSQVEQRVHELLDSVGLTPPDVIAAKFPHELSGGQKQRVAIARALAVEPKVVIADEPVSMLDVSIRAGILNLLKHFSREMRMAILYISHDLSTMRHICNRVAIMYLGRIAEIGSTDQVLDHPQHPYAKALMAAAPVMGGRRRERIQLEGSVPNPIDPPSGCRFHTRCPMASDRCREEDPALRPTTVGSEVACHLFD